MVLAAVFAKPKPREFIRVRKLDTADLDDIARLRLEHDGGPPEFTPPYWAGAFDGNRLVAAAGWLKVTETHHIVVEVNRARDRWGAVGTLVLVRALADAARGRGIRLQALVLPGNDRLKAALRENGAGPVAELWEEVR